MTRPIIYLYIDDDPEDQEIFSMALHQLTMSTQLLTAKNGKEAIEILMNTDITPHYIFLDIEMPVMDGFDTLVALEQLPKIKATRIIIYTDYLNEQRERLNKYCTLTTVRKFSNVNCLKDFLHRLHMQTATISQCVMINKANLNI